MRDRFVIERGVLGLQTLDMFDRARDHALLSIDTRSRIDGFL